MPPNVLFLMTDQQHAGMMSCTGNPWLATPAMDRLASEGVRFDRAYCANPVCVASRFSLMTGRMPSAIGLRSNRPSNDDLPPGVLEHGLGFLMRSAGYETAYGGKEHLPRFTARDIGFEYICRDEREALATACADFITRRRDQPFFLVASFINPHDICYMALRDGAETQAEQDLVRRGVCECDTLDRALATPSDKGLPTLPVNFEPQDDEPEAIRMMLDARSFRAAARRHWSKQRWREHRYAYARLTEMVDRQIATVLQALRAANLMEDTIIVFTSDHGDMDSAHRMEHKSTLYEEACRIPLIIRLPGQLNAGQVNRTHLVSNGLDLVPTFCDWAGIPAPADLQGRSLRGLAESLASPDWRTALPVECATGRAIITDRFKYARYDSGASREQVYDLARDPYEQRNALSDPAHRTIRDALRAQFDQTFAYVQTA